MKRILVKENIWQIVIIIGIVTCVFPFTSISSKLVFLFKFKKILNLLGWHWLSKLYTVQVHNSTTHHLYLILCVHHPKSSLGLSSIIKYPPYPPQPPQLLSPWQSPHPCLCPWAFFLDCPGQVCKSFRFCSLCNISGFFDHTSFVLQLFFCYQLTHMHTHMIVEI